MNFYLSKTTVALQAGILFYSISVHMVVAITRQLQNQLERKARTIGLYRTCFILFSRVLFSQLHFYLMDVSHQQYFACNNERF